LAEEAVLKVLIYPPTPQGGLYKYQSFKKSLPSPSRSRFGEARWGI